VVMFSFVTRATPEMQKLLYPMGKS
jgi:hypothetical protein